MSFANLCVYLFAYNHTFSRPYLWKHLTGGNQNLFKRKCLQWYRAMSCYFLISFHSPTYISVTISLKVSSWPNFAFKGEYSVVQCHIRLFWRVAIYWYKKPFFIIWPKWAQWCTAILDYFERWQLLVYIWKHLL